MYTDPFSQVNGYGNEAWMIVKGEGLDTQYPEFQFTATAVDLGCNNDLEYIWTSTDALTGGRFELGRGQSISYSFLKSAEYQVELGVLCPDVVPQSKKAPALKVVSMEYVHETLAPAADDSDNERSDRTAVGVGETVHFTLIPELEIDWVLDKGSDAQGQLSSGYISDS